MTIHEIIKNTRGFDKQDYFAGKLGISQSFLCNIEAGRRKPSVKVLRKLAAMTRKPLTYLILITYE